MVRVLTGALVLLLLAHTTATAQDLLLDNAWIVNPRDESVTRGSLLIADGRIVGRTTGVPDGFQGRIVDLSGKWVMPSLNEMHTHSFGNMVPGGSPDFSGTPITARRYLYAGVTSFLDLFSPEDMILPLRDQQRAAGLPGADIFAAGPCLTATSGHCSEYGVPTRIVDSPEDAQREVGALATKRPDVVKIVYDHAPGRLPTVNRETLAAVVMEARRHGLHTVVHIGTWDDARDAAMVGARAITHLGVSEPVPVSVAALMAERGTYAIPTLSVITDMLRYRNDPTLLDSPLLAAVATATTIDAYRNLESNPAVTSLLQRLESRPNTEQESITRLAAAGVRILTGTDAGNWGVFQAYSVHRELLRLVEAGLTTWQALAAATINAGDFLGHAFGVDAGDEANLLVLNASPVEDIRNTELIHIVVHHGRVVDREKLLRS